MFVFCNQTKNTVETHMYFVFKLLLYEHSNHNGIIVRFPETKGVGVTIR